MQTQIPFDLLRLSLLAVVIGYAAWSDHKCGEVKNKAWIYLPFGLSLTLISLTFNQAALWPSVYSFISTVAISFALFYMGGWGGADAKAFLTIGACMPVTPFIVGVPTNYWFMYPLMVVLVSSVLAFVAGRVKHNKAVRFLPFVFVSLFIVLLF
jgi:hypothetical protein